MKKENENNKSTRTRRNGTERRKHKRIYFAVIGVLLIVLLLLVVNIFSDNEKNSTNQATEPDQSSIIQDTSEEEETEETASSDTTDTSSSEGSDEENTEEEPEETDEDEDESEEEVMTEPAEPSDNLVTEAYTGDWEPVGTAQEGAHTTDYSDGSQDRIEIKRAVSMVTGLNPDNMIEWWVGNDGPDRVIATVSDPAETDIYRVYLAWVDDEGWRPTKVEELSENDRN